MLAKISLREQGKLMQTGAQCPVMEFNRWTTMYLAVLRLLSKLFCDLRNSDSLGMVLQGLPELVLDRRSQTVLFPVPVHNVKRSQLYMVYPVNIGNISMNNTVQHK